MNGSPTGGRWAQVSHRVLRPPVREPRFWLVQVMVVGLAAAHLAADTVVSRNGTIPAGIPVALLLAPVSYAALRYGLSGSVATAIGATVLWLPDLLLPRDEGHVGNDLIELALVIAVAVFVGYHIEAERLERAHARQARSGQQAAEARYGQLFNTNAAPILVASPSGEILDANPAARDLVPGDVLGRPVPDVLGPGAAAAPDSSGRVVAISTPRTGLRHYRIDVATVPDNRGGEPLIQLVLLDVTEELAEGHRVHRFAEFLLKVQEEERRRIAHELHDEPLQLLIHLARSLEQLTTVPQVPATFAADLAGARQQAVDIASRLRAVVAGLRPPALEQLGLAPALRGFLADVADTTAMRTDLRVAGAETRLPPHIELGAFRIAQEAVNNVIRHADATQLVLTVSFSDGQLSLQVTDDGHGFDPASSDAHLPAGRLGLLGMRERAALAGGRLTVQSAPGQGTIVTATFPREPGQAAPSPPPDGTPVPAGSPGPA